jgi:hypothetical protein
MVARVCVQAPRCLTRLDCGGPWVCTEKGAVDDYKRAAIVERRVRVHTLSRKSAPHDRQVQNGADTDRGTLSQNCKKC